MNFRAISASAFSLAAELGAAHRQALKPVAASAEADALHHLFDLFLGVLQRSAGLQNQGRRSSSVVPLALRRCRTPHLPLVDLVQKCFVANVQTQGRQLFVPVRLIEHPEHHFFLGSFSGLRTDLLQRLEFHQRSRLYPCSACERNRFLCRRNRGDTGFSAAIVFVVLSATGGVCTRSERSRLLPGRMRYLLTKFSSCLMLPGQSYARKVRRISGGNSSTLLEYFFAYFLTK